MTASRNVAEWQTALQQTGYLCTDGLARMVRLACELGRPLLLEGPAGVGKTALAAAVADVLGRDLLRLQCYEGIDASTALYDWNYHRQLADLTAGRDGDVFTEAYVLERPLLRALRSARGAVLLIDEVDRADEAFEALLLEYLGDFQISIPEWRTVTATIQPVTVLTSNRSRPLGDALRRRCLYEYVDWPDEQRELSVLELRAPALASVDRGRIVQAVRRLRELDLIKPPGLSETIDWGQALQVSADEQWTREWVLATLGCAVKDAVDLDTVRAHVSELIDGST